MVTGGFVAGRRRASQTVNHPTVGRAPGGAIVERPAPSLLPRGRYICNSANADFTTASRIAAALNAKYRERDLPARAENCGIGERGGAADPTPTVRSISSRIWKA